MYGLVDCQGVCSIGRIDGRNRTAYRELLRQNLKFLSKDISNILAKHKKENRLNLFWTAFMNSGAKLSYDWLSSVKQ
jgi:hypothetical protein